MSHAKLELVRAAIGFFKLTYVQQKKYLKVEVNFLLMEKTIFTKLRDSPIIKICIH